MLILRAFTVEKVKNQGYEVLLPFRNLELKSITILDASNTRKTESKIADDFYMTTWEPPKIVRLMEKIKLKATAILLRESIAIFKITSHCVKERIGVIRVYKHDYPALQASLVSTFIKIPFIVDIIGNFELIRRLTGKTYYFIELNKLPFLKIFAQKAANWLTGWSLRNAHRIICRGVRSCEYVASLGVPDDKLSFLRISNFSAVFNSYNPGQPPTNPAEYPYFLLVGRLVEVKYPLDALDAFDLAAPHLPEHRLVIIGDGALRDDIEKRRELSEYKDRIVLLGRCSSNTVFNWTAHATAALCPYSGSTLVEAMLCNIPIIAYDIGWHPEIVIDDYTGFLIPFRDTAALAEKMIYVVQNDDAARIVATHGRELARAAFNKEKILEKESMFYRQALTDSQR